jgi:hypothetical protein
MTTITASPQSSVGLACRWPQFSCQPARQYLRLRPQEMFVAASLAPRSPISTINPSRFRPPDAQSRARRSGPRLPPHTRRTSQISIDRPQLSLDHRPVGSFLDGFRPPAPLRWLSQPAGVRNPSRQSHWPKSERTAGMGGFRPFAGTRSGDKVAPTADLREVGSIVVGSSQRGRKAQPFPAKPRVTDRRSPSTRRGEANSDNLGGRTSKPIVGMRRPP